MSSVLQGKLIIASTDQSIFFISVLNLPKRGKYLGLTKMCQITLTRELGNRDEKILWSALIHV